MMAASMASRSSSNAGPKEESRVTRGGRKITYSMQVMQQPERARACGSGAKSSADRRPVDPPPVVELRIFSGEGPDREDITFAYEGNFFLFATLEARPIARSRLPQATPSPIPVLTGMPVSGMAYLDRPVEAGYFIFPDLSVRHEGQYQLSFSLYEETKNDCDKDAESVERKPAGFGAPGASDSSFDWRLEIKSKEFTVFSAKKFPGLTESTLLSRTISEQGCRVRIRRDVRMRRRETTKEVEEEVDYRQSRTPPSDDLWAGVRSRSHSLSPLRNGFENRQGETLYPGQTRSNLEFGTAELQGAPYFPAPPPIYSRPPPPPVQSYPPPPQNYHQAPAPYHQSHPASYSHERQYSQSAYSSNSPREQLPYEQDMRRASTSHSGVHPPADHPPQQSYRAQSEVQLPPIQMKLSRPTTPYVAPLQYTSLPPLIGGPRIEPDRPTYPVEARNGKRDYGSSFPSSSSALDNQRSMNGMRPDLTAVDENDNDDFYSSSKPLEYRRADDTLTFKLPPKLID